MPVEEALGAEGLEEAKAAALVLGVAAEDDSGERLMVEGGGDLC